MVDVKHPRRVAFAVPDWPPETAASGITSYVARVREGLESVGVPSAVLCAQAQGKGLPDAYDTLTGVRWPGLVRGGLSALWGVLPAVATSVDLGARYARTLATLPDVDLFEVEESGGVAAAVRPGFRGALVVRLHGPWALVGPALGARSNADFRARVWAERFAIGRADAVTAPSRYVLDFVQSDRRRPLQCAKVIPNPAPSVLDAQRWSPQTRDRDRVLFVGRFDRVKGPDILLSALERLVDRRPDLKLDLVGPDRGLDEPAGTISLADFLQQRVSPSLRARVTVHGSLSPSAIASIRRTAHVTVVCSRFESFSMTALEALAAGCPLVASDAGGIPEVVRDGVSGLLFRSEDTAHLAARIEEILSNDALAESLSREAVRACATRFSARSVAEQSLEVYEAAREIRRRR